jgi:hypothetical protein
VDGTTIEFGKGLSCEGDWLVSDSDDGFQLERLSTGVVSRFRIGTESYARRPRTDGRYLVWEDLRDDAKGVLNLLGYDSNVYLALLPDGSPSPVSKDPAIQASPDVGSGWVVWKDFRSSATPNFIGAKDQVDIYGKRIGAEHDVRLTSSPGVSFEPRVEAGKLFFRRRPEADPGAGIFMMDLR